MEEKYKLFDPKVTVDVRKHHKELVMKNPDTESRVVASLEVIKNHLMKAKIRNGRFTILSDEPSEFGGEDVAPSMFEYFVAGAMLCECAQYIWNAVDLSLIDSIHKLEMSIEGSILLAPWAGLTNDKSPALHDVKITVEIESDASPEDIERLVRVAGARCPARQSLRVPVNITNVVRLNGKHIAEFSDV